METIHYFTITPTTLLFPNTRIYLETPLMSSSDPPIYFGTKLDGYAYINDIQYEIKELIQLGVSYSDLEPVSSVILPSNAVLPMGNWIIPDETMTNVETNSLVGNSITINRYMLSTVGDTVIIDNIQPFVIDIVPSTSNDCYLIRLSYNHQDVINYVNAQYLTSYPNSEPVSCYVLLIIDDFNGALISAGNS